VIPGFHRPDGVSVDVRELKRTEPNQEIRRTGIIVLMMSEFRRNGTNPLLPAV